MSINIAQYGAKLFNGAKSYVESFGQKESPKPTYGQNLSTDIYQLGDREAELFDKETDNNRLQTVANFGKVAVPATLAVAGATLAFLSAPLIFPLGAAGVAILSVGASMVDQERVKIANQEIETEKAAIAERKDDLSARYQDASPEIKESAFEAIQEVREERQEYAEEMREMAKEESWPASRAFNKAAQTMESRELFFSNIQDAPPSSSSASGWTPEGQKAVDALIWNIN